MEEEKACLHSCFSRRPVTACTKTMYRAMIISGDESVRRKVHGYLTDLGLISEVISLDHTPNELELARSVRLKPTQLILLEVSSIYAAQNLMNTLEENSPSTSVVAFSSFADQRTIRQLMLMGIKGFLPIPVSRPVLWK